VEPGRSRSWNDQDGTAYLIAEGYDEDTETHDLWMKTQALGGRWSAPTHLFDLFGHAALADVAGHGHQMIVLARSDTVH